MAHLTWELWNDCGWRFTSYLGREVSSHLWFRCGFHYRNRAYLFLILICHIGNFWASVYAQSINIVMHLLNIPYKRGLGGLTSFPQKSRCKRVLPHGFTFYLWKLTNTHLEFDMLHVDWIVLLKQWPHPLSFCFSLHQLEKSFQTLLYWACAGSLPPRGCNEEGKSPLRWASWREFAPDIHSRRVDAETCSLLEDAVLRDSIEAGCK